MGYEGNTDGLCSETKVLKDCSQGRCRCRSSIVFVVTFKAELRCFHPGDNPRFPLQEAQELIGMIRRDQGLHNDTNLMNWVYRKRYTAQKWLKLPAMTKRCHSSWKPKTPGARRGHLVA